MIDLNLKCNNLKEAEFAVKYFLNNGCKWNISDREKFETKNFIYPLMIYNRLFTLKNILFLNQNFENFPYFYKITEAKHLMRKEKLKRIQ